MWWACTSIGGGMHVIDCNSGVIAVHHQNIGMDPIEFSRCTLRALEKAHSAITEAVARGFCPQDPVTEKS